MLLSLFLVTQASILSLSFRECEFSERTRQIIQDEVSVRAEAQGQNGPRSEPMTLQEKLAIALLVEDLLPGGKAAWEGNYLNEVIWNNGFKTDVDHDFHNYCDHRRKLPQRVLRQNLKRPY